MPADIDNPLTEQEYVELDSFLLSVEGQQCLPIDEAHGYLTALQVCSDAGDEASWMQMIWGEPDFADEATEQKMKNLMRRLNGEVAAMLASGDPFEPMVIEMEEEGETIEVYEGWCFGFMLAVSEDEERWDVMTSSEESLLAPIAKLAMLHSGEEVDIDEDEHEMLIELLPGAVVGLRSFWKNFSE